MATPTQVQKAVFGNGCGSTGTTDRTWPLPSAVLSGNAVIVCVAYADTSAAITVTDDGAASPNYTLLGSKDDTTAGAIVAIYYRLNISNSPSNVHIKFAVGGGTFVAGHVSEWQNVSTNNANFHVSAGNTGASLAPTPGTISPANGDLMISFAWVDNTDPTTLNNSNLNTWTKPATAGTQAGWTLDKADIWGADAVAYALSDGTANANSAWAFTLNAGGSNQWAAIQGSFTSASQGTAPSATPRVISDIHQDLAYGGSGTGGATTSPFHFTIPFSNGGTSMYAVFMGTCSPGTLNDSVNGNWSVGKTAHFGTPPSSSAGVASGFYKLSATLSQTMTATLTFTGPDPGTSSMNIWIREVTGVTTYDSTASSTNTGNNAATTIGANSAGNGAPSVTPSTANGLIFPSVVSLDATSGVPNCVKAISPGTFLTSVDLNEETANWINDNNNGVAAYSNPNTNAINFTWTTGVSNTRNWAAIGDVFEAPTTDVLLGQAVF